MLARSLPKAHETPPPAKTESLRLPGLVSSLRPLKRLSFQLSDETALLRRFAYKNKNQHKGCGWWRKVMEVDRVMERVASELQALLGEFGVDKEKEDIGNITKDAVAAGLLRLPRSMLIAEKAISVLLGSASILEQLIHSRAFLSFALVVVALIARLHALTASLFEDLAKTSTVLVRLAHANSLLPSIEKPVQQLPTILRRFISLQQPSYLTPPDLEPPSVNSSQLATPLGSPGPGPGDDFGAVVSRAEMRLKRHGKVLDVDMDVATNEEPATVNGTKDADDDDDDEARAAEELPMSLDDNPFLVKDCSTKSMTTGVERAHAVGRARVKESSPDLGKRKKAGLKNGELKRKRKKKKGGDEIDDIFG